MTEIGLNVVFQAMDFGTLLSRVNKGGQAGSDNWNCFCAAWPGPAVPIPAAICRSLAWCRIGIRKCWRCGTPGWTPLTLRRRKPSPIKCSYARSRIRHSCRSASISSCRRIVRVCRDSSVPTRRSSGTSDVPEGPIHVAHGCSVTVAPVFQLGPVPSDGTTLLDRASVRGLALLLPQDGIQGFGRGRAQYTKPKPGTATRQGLGVATHNDGRPDAQ